MKDQYFRCMMQRAQQCAVWGNKSRPYISLISNPGAFLLFVTGRVSCNKLSWMAPALQATQIRLSSPLVLLMACITSLLKPGRGGSKMATILLPRCCSQMFLMRSSALPRCTSQLGSLMRASSTASSQISIPITLTLGSFFMMEMPMVPIPHPKSRIISHSFTDSMIFWQRISHMSRFICRNAEGETWNVWSKICSWQNGVPHRSSGFQGGMQSASPLQDKKQSPLSPIMALFRYSTILALIFSTFSWSKPSVLATMTTKDCLVR